MSSSSTPDRLNEEGARLAIEEVEEAEAILDQRPPKAEGALGEGRGGGRVQRLGHDRAGGTGVALHRLLPARSARRDRAGQLLDPQRRGRRLRPDLDDRELLRPLPRLDLLEEHADDVRDVVDRRRRVSRLRLPGRVLPGAQGGEPALADRALHRRAGTVLDELPDARDRLDVPADGQRGRAQSVVAEAAHRSPHRYRSSASRCSRCGWR